MYFPVNLCWVLAAAVAIAQAPAQTGVIGGVVLDSVTEKPVRRAVVTLLTTEARPQDAVAWTDAEGRFAFGYLPAGHYRLAAYKPGYQTTMWGAEGGPRSRGKILTLAAGENKNNLTLKLSVGGSITGTVSDEDGDPIAGAQVSIYIPATRRGLQTIQSINSAITDSQGRYRIANVFPGDFVVGVDIESEAVKGKAEVSVGERHEQYMYANQFYPGTSDFRSASKVTVGAGTQVDGVNFRLQALPMATLRGQVIVPPEVDVSTAQIQISQDSAMGLRMFRSVGAGPPDFAFQMPGLRPGPYKVIAYVSGRGKEYRGVQQVQVGRDNDVIIALEPAVELSGTAKIEGPDAAKYSVATVSLSPGDQIPNSRPVRAPVAKDGTFKLPGVLPGVWDINVSPIPPGGYIKSMYLGDQDVLTQEMVIRSSTTAPLRIVVSTAGAAVEGNVEDAEAGARYFVVLSPTGKFASVDSFRVTAQTDDKAHYELKGITPGSYNLWAFTTGGPMQGGPDLKALEGEAVKVELKEGQRLTKDLKAITPGGQN